jgi:hypothetical protein
LQSGTAVRVTARSSAMAMRWDYGAVRTLTLDDYLDKYADDHPSQGDASFVGVWGSARGFAEFLELHNELVDVSSVLELGAGTGWLGSTIAHNAPQMAEVRMTDRAEWWLAANIAATRAGGNPISAATTSMFDWSSGDDRKRVAGARHWDLVVGCDLAYSEDRIGPLVASITALLKGGALRMLYCHTPRGDGSIGAELERCLAAAGIVRSVVGNVILADRDDLAPVWELTL